MSNVPYSICRIEQSCQIKIIQFDIFLFDIVKPPQKSCFCAIIISAKNSKICVLTAEVSFMNNNNGKIIQSVQRAIDIINCFDDVNTALSLGQISERLELNKSTVHGILNTLHCNDFVRQIPSGQYMLGSAMFGRHRQEGDVRRKILWESARSTMYHIANEYYLNCSLFMLEIDELILVRRILPEHAVYTVNCSSDSYINPLYCTASGKILLSTMDSEELDIYLKNHKLIAHTANTITSREKLMEALAAIRAEGFGIENEELGMGVSALSVPVWDAEHKLAATVSVTGISYLLNSRRKEIIAELKALATRIEGNLF